ncbi:MAG TPA: ABC transporter permease [Pyrinomonadaceae bacterium]|nr:ABC transporter permease [Pyrinomonadaceae bacterium]
MNTTESQTNLAATGSQQQTTSTPDVFEDAKIVIDARDAALGLHLRELWNYRELLLFLTWRDIQLRYKQTALGATWVIIQPLFTMLLFTLFFGKLAHMPSDNVPYPLFAYAGLVPWTFFSNALTNSGQSLVGNSSLISKVYFPRIYIPAGAVGAGLLDFAIASVLLLPMLIYYDVTITWRIFLLPAFALLATILALGVGMWLAALNVRYRDVRYAIPFLVQLWLFASPVIYPASIVPPNWKWLLAVNPVTGVIEGFRASILGKEFDVSTILSSVIVTSLILVFSFFAFRRVEDSFADVV